LFLFSSVDYVVVKAEGPECVKNTQMIPGSWSQTSLAQSLLQEPCLRAHPCAGQACIIVLLPRTVPIPIPDSVSSGDSRCLLKTTKLGVFSQVGCHQFAITVSTMWAVDGRGK
jgi:hypothetical protein